MTSIKDKEKNNKIISNGLNLFNKQNNSNSNTSSHSRIVKSLNRINISNTINITENNNSPDMTYQYPSYSKEIINVTEDKFKISKTHYYFNTYIIDENKSINKIYIDGSNKYPNNYSIKIWNNSSSSVILNTNNVNMFNLIYLPSGNNEILLSVNSCIELTFFKEKWSVNLY